MGSFTTVSVIVIRVFAGTNTARENHLNISWVANFMSFLNTKYIHSTVTTFLLGPNGLKLLVQFYVPQHLALEQPEF